MSAIEVKNLVKKFHGQTVLHGIDLEVKPGEVVAIIGPSGSGKTTLLRSINLLEQPEAGTITVGDITIDTARSLSQQKSLIRQLRQHVGFVFQNFNLLSRISALENVALPLIYAGVGHRERMERAMHFLEAVGLKDRADHLPNELSGGQRQRVALARSLAKRPKLLLLDEPMGALDKKLRDRMQLEVVDILERVGVTCVMVTHDQEEAMTMAGRIAIMNRGKFVQIGEPEEIYEHPTTRYSAEFIGSVNVFEGLVKERLEDGLVLSSPGLMHPLKVDPDASVVDNVPVWVALRPEKIMLCDEPPADGYNFAVGEVIHIAYLGDLSIYHVRLQSGQMISAQLQNEHRHRKGTPTWGDEVRLCWDADSCVVLTV